MEQQGLSEIVKELGYMRKAIEDMQVYLVEDGLEVSDEVIKEVEEARKSEGISHEDIVKEFCG